MTALLLTGAGSFRLVEEGENIASASIDTGDKAGTGLTADADTNSDTNANVNHTVARNVSVDRSADPEVDEPAPSETNVASTPRATVWRRWKVLAAGLCRTDSHLARHPVRCDVVLGHEVVCVDEGGGVHVLNNEICCGECDYCLEGKTSHCRHLRELGVNEHGGFATHIHAPEDHLSAFEGTDPRIGTLVEPMACALHAIDRLRKIGALQQMLPRVLIVGSGVSGKLLAFALHRLQPDWPLSIFDVQPQALRWADAYPDITTIDPSHDVGEGRFEIALECTGQAAGSRTACRALRRGGILMMYGMPSPEVSFDLTPHDLFRRELTMMASVAGCSADRFAEALRFVTDHQDFFNGLIGRTIGFDAVPDALLHAMPLAGTRTLLIPE